MFQELQDTMDEIKDDLEELFLERGLEGKLLNYGSSLNGTLDLESDLDLTFVTSQDHLSDYD